MKKRAMVTRNVVLTDTQYDLVDGLSRPGATRTQVKPCVQVCVYWNARSQSLAR